MREITRVYPASDEVAVNVEDVQARIDIDTLLSYLKAEAHPEAAIEALNGFVPKAVIETLEDFTANRDRSWAAAVERIKKLLEE